jgi:hypothetical protein
VWAVNNADNHALIAIFGLPANQFGLIQDGHVPAGGLVPLDGRNKATQTKPADFFLFQRRVIEKEN